jgi:hypothetical protein
VRPGRGLGRIKFKLVAIYSSSPARRSARGGGKCGHNADQAGLNVVCFSGDACMGDEKKLRALRAWYAGSGAAGGGLP